MRFVLSFALMLSLGCGDDDGVADTGTDSATMDAGTDVGSADAGGDASGDAGERDAGEDAGDDAAIDATTADAGDDAGGDAALADAGNDAAADAGDAGMPMAFSYHVTRDFRRCASPFCGGFWVQAVNLEETICADGSTSADGCYVAGIDWSDLPVSADTVTDLEGQAGNLVIDGLLSTEAFPPAGAMLGSLRVNAAWVARWGTAMIRPTGETFYHLADNGIRCLVPPCFSNDLTTLNEGTMLTTSGVDLSGAGAPALDEDAGYAALTAGTLRATGPITTDPDPGPGGAFGETLRATQFYLQVIPSTRD